MSPSELFSAGRSRNDALDRFRANVNLSDTIFSRDHWLIPKLEQLKDLLSDPLTQDQAAALDDVLHQRQEMRILIDWIESAPTMPWRDFPAFRDQREKEDAWREWLKS